MEKVLCSSRSVSGRNMHEAIIQEHRQKPPRLPYVFSQEPLYFVTMTCWLRRDLLANEEVLKTVKEYGAKVLPLGVAIGRYMLMPDHMHLFVRITGGSELSIAIKLLKQEITKIIRATRPGVRVWQPGFFDL